MIYEKLENTDWIYNGSYLLETRNIMIGSKKHLSFWIYNNADKKFYGWGSQNVSKVVQEHMETVVLAKGVNREEKYPPGKRWIHLRDKI